MWKPANVNEIVLLQKEARVKKGKLGFEKTQALVIEQGVNDDCG